MAKSNLDTGQIVGASDLGWQTWPAAPPDRASSASPTGRTRSSDFVGAIVRTPVMAGEPIRDTKVVPAKGGGFMAAILPHGMRAVAIDVSPDTGVGGFILPNDHVDIVLTRRDKAAEKVSGSRDSSAKRYCETSGCWPSIRPRARKKARRS